MNDVHASSVEMIQVQELLQAQGILKQPMLKLG